MDFSHRISGVYGSRPETVNILLFPTKIAQNILLFPTKIAQNILLFPTNLVVLQKIHR